jgi:hypothetical protein
MFCWAGIGMCDVETIEDLRSFHQNSDRGLDVGSPFEMRMGSITTKPTRQEGLTIFYGCQGLTT